MNLSGSNLQVTYAIMAVNVAIFILMAISGAGIFESNGYVHIKWGSNYAPLTLSGDWWRLITSVFLHFGIIHLAMNMYCLYMVGVYLEPMLGKVKYTAAYLCTGILASVVSLWWHKEPVNSAGASGAVFGLYGLFLALLTTNLIPQHFRKSLLQSIALFIVFNLFYGLKGGVDNAAHIGGLLSGFIIGYIYLVGIKKEKQQQKVQWIIPVVAIFTLLSAFGYLQLHKVSSQTRLATLNVIAGASFKDYDKYNEKMNEVSLKETAALEALRGTDSITREEFVSRLNQALPIWDTIAGITKSAANYKVSEANHKRAEKLLEYVLLRKKQYNLLIVINTSSVNNIDIETNKELEETNEKVSKIVDELNTL